MLIVASLHELAEKGIERVAVTCGVFDGLHRGHRELIATMEALARETDAVPVVFTFQPHPARVLSPGGGPPLLMSDRHKLILLEDLGVAATVLFPFTAEVAAIEPEDFLGRLLFGSGVTVTAVVVGENWRFGYKARGDVALLSRYGKARGAQVVGVPELQDSGEPVSSTRIRRRLAEGDLGTVERLLGRPFSILGEIEHGKGIGGSELHYPTANVKADNEVFPPCGIYAAKATLRQPGGDSRTCHEGILYLGYSPTFVDRPPEKPFVEMHLFRFHRDVYGMLLEVEFLAFIRPDARYGSADALCRQIAIDIEQAKVIHASRRG